MSSLKSIIGRRVVTLLYYAFRIFPVKKKKIFVKNFFGKGYGDSPKYIIDYLLKNYSGFDIVWSVSDDYCRGCFSACYCRLALTFLAFFSNEISQAN